MILATAVIEKLHRFDKNAQIDVLVRKGNESLLSAHPFIRTCFVWDKKENKYSGLLKLVSSIRAVGYDAVINLQRFAASGFITAFSGAKEKIGFDKNPMSFLFTKSIPHNIGSLGKHEGHEVERCLKTIEHLTDGSYQAPKLYPSEKDFSSIAQFIQGEFVTISPASVWFTKQTPAKVWSDLISSSPAEKFYLLGSPADRQLCESIAGANQNVEVLAGTLSLLQSAALMSKAKMNFTNDSAPMHLCSAMNAPVTAVFCSTIPEFGFGPLSENAAVVQSRLNLPCKPCGIHGYSACPKTHFDCGKILNQDLTTRLTFKSAS